MTVRLQWCVRSRVWREFRSRREIDAAAIRSTTVAQMNEVKLRGLGNFLDEWKKMTNQCFTLH